MNSYFFKSALLPDGWHQQVRVEVVGGRFVHVEQDAACQPEDQQFGVVIPAMPNVHSHVFQRAMAGHSEYKSQHSEKSQDSFWSWRVLMYQLANEMDHDSLYQVAKNCYQEMLDAGYASVCEFHYVHRSLGQPSNYYRHAEILLQAANEVGLPITLLPVLYAFSAVGDAPLNPQQKRFELSVDEYLDLYRHLQTKLTTHQNLGICFHSIRAVNLAQMQQVISALPDDVPIHLHIAEQQAEIDQSIKHHGLRPVEWLYRHFKVDQRWSLVHATHLNEAEIKLIADSGSVAVICPLTEANLGDGVFPMPSFMDQQGVWAIGSDSHVEIKPQQELKMLEYSQRLVHQQRNVCCDQNQPHVGTWQWLQAVHGGNQASGAQVAGIASGSLAKVVELTGSDDHRNAEIMLDSWLFSDRIHAKARQL